MIASISGVLQHIGPNRLIVQVGGVGLEIFVPASVIARVGQVGQRVDLLTHLVVREDMLALYGFLTEEEKYTFEMLLTVPGVGPRLALAILNSLSPEQLASAVHREEAELIARVPGVGKKTSQKIVLELKGRLAPAHLPGELAAISARDTEVMEALTAMGFSIVEAQAAIQSIPRDAPDELEERIRLALNYFAR